jgi:LytS/YehU family sensor histidine kinase
LFLGGLVSYYAIRYLLDYHFLPALGKPIFDPYIERKFFTDQSFLYCNYTVYGLLYVFAIRAIEAQKNLRKKEKDNFTLQNQNLKLEKDKFLLQSQNLRLQNEKLKAEYNFLKAQINPHFLYNTLNFFYAKTATTDPKTAEGISLLTDIMRYSLQEGGPDSKVPLKDEIAHLKNYINLQQMRFNNTLNILFKDEVRAADCRVLPHIFITLVENAFKHGEINNPMYPLEISLTEKDDQLLFSVRNKIRNGPVDSQSTGVGLNNIRTRLKMEYGDAARLENSQTEDYFAVNFYVPFALLGRPPHKQEDQAGTNPVSFINQKIAL